MGAFRFTGNDMALPTGARIGTYDIVALIGAGGMGEVYRARDVRLDRDVAIKVLPESFAQAPDRLARFAREAKTLAAVNHSNIATIHGFEEWNGVQALVMELVEGKTLADRIAEGPVPIDEALAIARQIAEALEAAHDNGVIHRDLKPANVKITPDDKVKVLDFGLAKAIERASGPSPIVSQSPTITTPAMLSGAGMILGTAAYMSPEQAKAKAADRRSDLWAFGCVLFEMLTGRRAFQGEDVGDIMAAVLRGEPDWTALPAEVPPAIRRLLRRCLEKDRRRRLDSAAVARLEIDDAHTLTPESSAAWSGRKRLLISVALAGGGALVAGVVAWMMMAGAPATAPPTRLSLNVEPGLHLGEAPSEALFQQRPGLMAFALSPDGRQLVYVGHDGRNSLLYVRHLDQDKAVPLAGTTGAQSPFFSPDGREIAFFVVPRDPALRDRDDDGAIIGREISAAGAIRRVSLDGGVVRTVEIPGAAPRVFPSATWSADDTLLMSGPEGIHRVPARGGGVERLVAASPGVRLRFPQLLPDGRAILFNVLSPASAPSLGDIVAETLDTHERTVVVRGGVSPRLVASGHLVFVRSGKVMAVPFDAKSLTARGDPAVVIEDVMQSEEGRAYFRANGTGQFAISRSGDLAYVTGGVYAPTKDILVWVDRFGRAVPLPIPPATIGGATISPDGGSIAWAQGPVGQLAIWLFDVKRGVARRLTEEGRGYSSPVWNRDGTRLAAAARDDKDLPVLAIIDVDGGGVSQSVRFDAGGHSAAYWPSPNTVLLQRVSAGTTGRLATLALDGTNQVKPLFEWSSQMQYPAFSRDGKWMSYSLSDTGEFELYVRSVPGGTPVTRVSVNGGTSSAWSADGRELFYREGSRMMVVPISTEGGFRQLAPPRPLFSGDYLDGSVPSRGFDVLPDGSRFLLKARGPAVASAPVTSINVVLNWQEELKRLVPLQ
jgi:serine/threonine-protein kinase